jgi:hypothetical protein
LLINSIKTSVNPVDSKPSEMPSPLENQVQQDMASLHIASPNPSHDSGKNISQTSQSESSESAPMTSNFQSFASANNLFNTQILSPDPNTIGVLLAGLVRIIAGNAEFNRESNRQLIEQLRPNTVEPTSWKNSGHLHELKISCGSAIEVGEFQNCCHQHQRTLRSR